jgi:hypothetical protein
MTNELTSRHPREDRYCPRGKRAENLLRLARLRRANGWPLAQEPAMPNSPVIFHFSKVLA